MDILNFKPKRGVFAFEIGQNQENNKEDQTQNELLWDFDFWMTKKFNNNERRIYLG